MKGADFMGCWPPIIFAPVAIFFPLWKCEDARSLLTPHLWSPAVHTTRCLGLWALEWINYIHGLSVPTLHRSRHR